MAEVLSNTNVFSRCNGNSSIINQQKHHHQHIRRVSVLPSSKSTNIFLRSSSSPISNFYGRRVVIGAPNKGLNNNTHRKAPAGASNAWMGIGIAKAQRWWEKGLKTNMKEVEGPQDLVESLLIAGDKLVVVDFFSPGCGGCKALHPKICQLAEMNPDVQFLQIKKFKDALAKHSPDRCSLGAPKGLEEKELVALSANKELPFTYKPKPEQPVAVPEQEKIFTAPVSASHLNSYPPALLPRSLQPNTASKSVEEIKDNTLISSGR